MLNAMRGALSAHAFGGLLQQGAAAPTTDPSFANVGFLSHLNAAPFTDVKGHSIVDSGGVPFVATPNKFGGGSAHATGGSLLSVSGVALGAGAFTIEGWVYIFSVSAFSALLSWKPSAGGFSDGPGLYVKSNLTLDWSNTVDGVTTASLSLNSWHHFSACRSGTTVYASIDGNVAAVNSDSNNYTRSVMNIGANGNASQFIDAYFNDVRVTQGVARYTSNFTPPNAPFPNQ